MCQYRTWCHNDKMGYVVQCTECKRLQLGYGNIMVTFYPEEFESFRKLVKDLYNQQHPMDQQQLKTTLIPTPCDCVTLLLSQQDLNGLYTMLEQADNEMRVVEMLQLFSIHKE